MRSRAHPWFALADRLERYAVRLDELDEAGGLHSVGGLLWADDFDFERWEPPPAPPCVHRYIQTRAVVSHDPFRVHETVLVCSDCGADMAGRPGLIGQMTFSPPIDLSATGGEMRWVTASTGPPPNPNPRSGFTRTRYTASGMKIEDLGGDD